MFSIASAILATLIKARITKPCGVSFACRAGADLFALHTLNLTYYTFGELLSEIKFRRKYNNLRVKIEQNF